MKNLISLLSVFAALSGFSQVYTTPEVVTNIARGEAFSILGSITNGGGGTTNIIIVTNVLPSNLITQYYNGAYLTGTFSGVFRGNGASLSNVQPASANLTNWSMLSTSVLTTAGSTKFNNSQFTTNGNTVSFRINAPVTNLFNFGTLNMSSLLAPETLPYFLWDSDANYALTMDFRHYNSSGAGMIVLGDNTNFRWEFDTLTSLDESWINFNAQGIQSYRSVAISSHQVATQLGLTTDVPVFGELASMDYVNDRTQSHKSYPSNVVDTAVPLTNGILANRGGTNFWTLDGSSLTNIQVEITNIANIVTQNMTGTMLSGTFSSGGTYPIWLTNTSNEGYLMGLGSDSSTNIALRWDASNNRLIAPAIAATGIFIGNGSSLTNIPPSSVGGGAITNGQNAALLLQLGVGHYLAVAQTNGTGSLIGYARLIGETNGLHVRDYFGALTGVVADTFTGDGSGLTNISSSIPAYVVTNNQQNVSLGGSFTGNGSGLTNLNAVTANPTVIPSSALGVLVFPGPHGNLRATVHPNALALATNWPANAGMNGANLWLAFTGTTNQTVSAFGTDTEDPFVASSSDGGLTWRVRTPFPLQTQAAANTLAGWGGTGWQADTELYISPDGVMHLIWSGFLDGVNFNSVLFHSSTADGDTWSAPEIMHAGPTLTEATYAGSQIVTMGDGTLRLYYVDENYGTNALLYQTGLDLSGTNWNWAETNFCDTLPYTTNTSAPWHFDMVVRNGAEHIFYGSQSGNPGEYATSTNANIFSAGVIGFWPIATLTNKNSNQQWIYKVTVWPSQTAPDAWNAIVGLSPANPTDMEGWAFKLIRDYQPDFNRMSVKTHTTNTWDLFGASKTYLGAARPSQFAVYEQVAPGNSATVTLGRKASGYGAVGFGTTPLNGSTRYALAGDGSVTLLNTFSDGRIRVADVDVGGWAADGIYAAASKQFSGSGAGLTNLNMTNVVGTQLNFGDGATITRGAGEVFEFSTEISGTHVGTGDGLTNLNAGNLASGTVPSGRVSGADNFTVSGVTLLQGYTEIGTTNRVTFGVENFTASSDHFQISSGYRNFYFSTNAPYSEGHGYMNFYSSTYAPYSDGHGYQNFYSCTYAPYSEGHGYRNFYSCTYAPYSEGHGNRNFSLSTNAPYSEGHGNQNFYSSTYTPYSEGHGNQNFYSSTYAPYSEGHGYRNFYFSTNSPAAYGRGNNNATNVLDAAGAWFSGTQVQNPWGWDARGVLNIGALIFGRGMYTNLVTPMFGAAPGGQVGIATTNLIGTLSVGGDVTASTFVATAGGRGGLAVNGVTNVQEFGASYTAITNWTTAKTGARVGISTSLGTLTLTNAGTYWVFFQAACFGAGTSLVEVAAHQDGVENNTLETSRTFSTSRGSMSFGGHLTTTTNNSVIDVRIKALAGTETISFLAAQFSAHRILD